MVKASSRRSAGGFDRLNKVFDGELEQVLGDVSDAIWERAGELFGLSPSAR